MSYCNNTAGARSPRPRSPCKGLLGVLLLSTAASIALADADSARLAMEDPGNPLFLLSTSRGQIYIEMLPAEAPTNTARVMALARGEIEIIDTDNDFSFSPEYYNGQRFHRTLPGFVIQAASPAYHPLGGPGELLADEINADALGLAAEPVLTADASVNALLNITDEEAFGAEVLTPLYADMNIDNVAELATRQDEIYTRLQSLTVKSLYELQGYRYSDRFATRAISHGIVALANSGPDSNGAEFFIALADAPSLTGRYTVIGRVVEGMAVADEIGATPIDPERFSRLSTVIYSFDEIESEAAPATALQ